MHRRSSSLLLAVLAVLAIAAAGCGGGGEGDDAGPGGTGGDADVPTAEDLDGRTFLVTSWTVPLALDGDVVRISFSDGELSFTAGCNTHTGSYRLDGDRLVVQTMMSTMMGCDPELHERDEYLAALLQGGERVQQLVVDLDGDVLVLTNDQARIELLDEQVALPDAPLVGTTWTLTTILTGTGPDGTASSVPAGVEPPTIELAEDGTVALFDGCLASTTTVEVGAEALTFGAVDSTDQACDGSSEGRRVLDAVHAVIQAGDVSYALDGTSLTLTRGDRGLVFIAG